MTVDYRTRLTDMHYDNRNGRLKNLPFFLDKTVYMMYTIGVYREYTERRDSMKDGKLAEKESRFAEIIWENEPMPIQQLIALSGREFGWDRTTTYTVLRRLTNKGLFLNDNQTVRAVISREEYYAKQGEQFIEDAFDGSLPAFIAAFTSRKNLTEKEIAEIRQMIDELKGE